MKNKIKTIKEMESKLLSDSTADDMHLPEKINHDFENTIMTAQQVRHDISVIARTFIHGYCGWPFHTEIVKRQILVKLLKIHNNASDMTIKEFFDLLKPVVAKIPDNHIRFILGHGDYTAKTELARKHKNVGRNRATFDEKIKVEKIEDVAVLAIRTLSNWQDEHFDKIKELENMLDESKCLIVDLRGNGGGSSSPTNKLADILYGAKTGGLVRSWIRTTPEATIIQNLEKNKQWANLDRSKDPTILADFSKMPPPAFASDNSGWARPIYILTDRGTCSSAEIFVIRMIRHPNVKYVGDNTGGMEIYAEMGFVVLPNSNIKFGIGNVYHELEQKNFELIGHKPDIKCQDGKDAFEVAINDYNMPKILVRAKKDILVK